MAKSVGLNLSSLINSYLRQVVATRRIELYAPETITPELAKQIKVVEAEIQTEGTGKAFADVEEFLADLKKPL